MVPSFVRTRNQRKIEEESQKYNSKRKYNAKKQRIYRNEGQEQAINANCPVDACNEGEEQAVNDFNIDQEQAQGYESEQIHCEERALFGEERVCSENEMPSHLNAGAEMETEKASEVETANTSRKRGHRGLTKAKRLPLNYQNRIEVEFNDMAIPIGPGSVYLSSFLGPLVREHVPYTLDDWRLLSDELKIVLWESILARFKLEEDWQKKAVFQQMGVLWRNSKSKLVRKINQAETEEERLNLKPANIKSMIEWRKFVKAKTSMEFKKRSEKYMAIRKKQLPHTSGRRGMARLTEDLKMQSSDPSSITRVDVWIKSHIRKNGEPVSMDAANAIEEVKKLDNLSQSSTSYDVKGDAIAQVLGQDKPGWLRAMGRGSTLVKLSMSRSRDKKVSQCQQQIAELQSMVKMLMDKKGKESSKEGSTHEMGNAKVCEVLNWDGTSEVVAEGRVVSTDPNDVVNGIRIGPNAVSIVIDCVDKPDVYLWRPTPHMSVLGNAENKLVAWPASCIKMALQGQSNEVSTINSVAQDNKCKIYDWNEGDEIVAEGRICSSDSGAIVNGIPLGPSAIVVLVDNVKNEDAYLWRPTTDMSYIGDAISRKIAWPKSKVEAEKRKGNGATSSSAVGPVISKKPPQYPIAKLKTNDKCKLIDVGKTNEVVAEGSIASTDSTSMVHCRPLGPDAVRVWVELVTVPNAELWRPSSELKRMEDAFGTAIAWPIAKVIAK